MKILVALSIGSGSGLEFSTRLKAWREFGWKNFIEKCVYVSV